jgi:DNA polymerase-3 subunit gamma/tau
MLIKRETSSGANDLQTVYRPCTVDEIIGQELTKKIINTGLKEGSLAHSFLFTGPAGCGKTTMARVIALGLNCKSVEKSTNEPCLDCECCKATLFQKNMDVIEINVGKDGGKGAVTKIVEDLNFAPLMSRYKVLIFDEAHELTKSSQDLLLKVIEDGFSHVYFIFCTNKPEKLAEAFISRTTILKFGYLEDKNLLDILINICEFEGASYDIDVLNYVVDISKGVPRNAIKYLKQVFDEKSWNLVEVKKLLHDHILDEDSADLLELSNTILKGSFRGAVKLLPKFKNIPAESVRVALAGMVTYRLQRARGFDDGDKYSNILDFLTVPIYVTGKPAQHILVNYLYKIARIMKG